MGWGAGGFCFSSEEGEGEARSWIDTGVTTVGSFLSRARGCWSRLPSGWVVAPPFGVVCAGGWEGEGGGDVDFSSSERDLGGCV